MTMISSLHNLSRSLGCALLAITEKRLVWYFIGGEVLIYLMWKIIRGDFLYWIRFDGGFLAIALSLFDRVLHKIIMDFSGCLHLRHP